MEYLPTNIPDLEKPFLICLLTKATKIPRGPSTDVSTPSPFLGFMINMDFTFFNVESICGLTWTFVDICSNTSQPFIFPSRRKLPPLEILKFLVNTLRNQDKKFAFILVDEYGALEISSEFLNTCHNMNIIVQTTGGNASSLNGKS